MAMILRSNIVLLCRNLKFPKTDKVFTASLFTYQNCKPQSLIPRNSCYNVSKRFISRFFRKPSIRKYKQLDDIPDHFQLIYRNTMDRYILVTHLGTFAIATIVTLLAILKQDLRKSEIDFKDWKEKPATVENEVLFYVACVLLLAVALHSFLAKLPLRIYKVPKQKEYVLIFNGGIPLTRRRLNCKTGQLQYIGEDGIIPWKRHLYKVKDEHKVILMDNYFQKPADLYVMLGEQQDLDLE